nr:uncharacterized protein LOC109786279 [Aegilops tauschii subsp. strangulata]
MDLACRTVDLLPLSPFITHGKSRSPRWSPMVPDLEVGDPPPPKKRHDDEAIQRISTSVHTQILSKASLFIPRGELASDEGLGSAGVYVVVISSTSTGKFSSCPCQGDTVDLRTDWLRETMESGLDVDRNLAESFSWAAAHGPNAPRVHESHSLELPRYIFSSPNISTGRPFLATHLPQDSLDPTYLIPDKNEVLQILKDMKLNASPGPDGFNVEFYLAAWEWIGEEVTHLVVNFYKTANRLKPHLPDYIDPAQQAFIEGRRISDNIIIAQEITHSFALKSWNNHAFMLKIDLAKAFDRLEWNFIVSALARKGLHDHFINLIYACISSPTFSVAINGQPSHKFRSSRGIRQGCPMCPYLFVIAINELSLALNEALATNNLQGISLGPNCPPIHSLLFADDPLVCGQATVQEATSMAQLIHHFCSISGQTPNWTKSAIMFSSHVSPAVIQELKQIFPVPNIDSNFSHLGHPLILPAKNRTAAYNFVLDKFVNKLPTYKANMLSHAARLELIRSVFSAIPVYYMANILFSKKFLIKLTAIIRNFWWTGVKDNISGRSLCLRAWKDICNSKQEGGLGVRNLQAINEGLILAAAWCLAKAPFSHLHLVLKSKYFSDASVWTASSTTPKSAFWSSILKMMPKLKAHSFYQLTQGYSCQPETYSFTSSFAGERSSQTDLEAKDDDSKGPNIRLETPPESSAYRCGQQEDEMHLFFLCDFARAAWFSHLWFIRTDVNDHLFDRKKVFPYHVHIAATALSNDANDLGRTIKSDLLVAGPKVYSDAAFQCKKIPGLPQGAAATGIGVYLSLPQDHMEVNVQIQASATITNSPLQDEALALLLAAQVAKRLCISQPTFFTDNLSLASWAASRKIKESTTPWTIRKVLADFFCYSSDLQSHVFHISREINGIAHNVAHQLIGICLAL